MQERLLSIAEAARYVGVTTEMLAGLKNAGIINCVKRHKGKVLFERKSLDEYLDGFEKHGGC